MANLVPKVNNTGSIGTSAKKWSNVHTTTLSVGAQAADLSLNSQKITNLATPTASTDAANKAYVDDSVQGLSSKDSVRAATTANGTLATAFANSQAIDGVTLATGDRVLLKNQTAGAENGIYTVNASGAPTRAVDFDANAEVAKGAFIFVEEGTSNANAGFVLTTDGAITLGTTALAFTQFSGAGQITAGDGIAKSGNTLSVDIPGSDEMTGDVVDTDELLISDGGTLKRADFSVVRDSVFADVSGDATVAAGGALSLTSTSITGQTALTTIADDDLILISDTSESGVLRKMTKATFVTGLGAASAIDDLSDVTITSAASSEYLRYNGSAWVDAALSIADDTTPQLGGSLDVNGQDIVTVSNGNITLTPNGSGVVRIDGTAGIDLQSGEIAVKNSGSVSNIKLYCETGNTHYTQIQSAAHTTYGGGGNVTLTLPTATGILISSGDAGTVTNTMLAGSITASKMNNAIFADLETLGAPASDGQFIVATGSGAFAYESANTARTSLGLGTGNSPTFTSLTLSGQAAALAMNSQKITGLATPTADADAATKSYVDGVAQGLSAKDSVRAATTANGTLATAFANSQAIDGVTLATGDRILLKNQSTATENGIYTVNASGAPTRAVDFDSNAEVAKGAFIFVEEGTTNADAGFVLTTDGAITLGSTSLAFTQFSGAGDITAGSALTKSGNTLNVAVDDSSIEVSSDALRVKASGVTSAMLAGSIANSKLNTISTANKVALTALDLDGGTDIGADLVDADLVVVDDGAGGTNRKSALSRMKKYIFSAVSGDATATDAGAFTVASSGVAADDITAGNSAVDISTNSGNLTINNSGLGIFTLKHVNTSGSSIDVLNFNRLQNGLAEFYAPIQTCVTGTGTNILGGINTEITGHLYPGSNNNRTLGKAANTWSDLYLGDSSYIYFGNDQEIELKHDPDDGLILKMVGSTTYDPSLVLLSDSSSTTGPKLQLRQDSTTPADGDRIGTVEFVGDDSAGNITAYGFVAGYSSAVASGAEVGKIVVSPYQASSNSKGLSVEGVSGSSTKVKVDIDSHNGSDSGLHLDGTLVKATAAELNVLDASTQSPSDDEVLTYTTASGLHWASAGGGGGGSLPPEVKAETTSNFTVSLTPSNASNFNALEVIYAVSNGSTAVTATLPTAASIEGKKVHVKRLGTANVTVDGYSSETIDGSTTFVLTTQYSTVTMISDGTNWLII